MRNGVFGKCLVLMSVLTLCAFALPRPSAACAICKHFFFLGYVPCQPVLEGEVGATVCTNHYDPISGFWCEESGDFCSGIMAGGGGGSTGGSGGGSDPCGTTGFCPAECFNCADGGGRPAN